MKLLQANELNVLLGRFNLKHQNEPDSIQAAVSEILIHPDWDYMREKWDADLAILVMTMPVKFTNYIKAICLTNDASIENQK